MSLYEVSDFTKENTFTDLAEGPAVDKVSRFLSRKALISSDNALNFGQNRAIFYLKKPLF